jgi:energy-coupling factor transport system ATP-binding protein
LPVLEHTGTAALSVETGEIVAVLGSPGSGKTRLAFELAFLARPLSGEVLFHGRNPLQRKRAAGNQRPREVTMLVQNAEDQLFARTVFDDVAFGPRHLNLTQEEIEDRVGMALETVRLEPSALRDRSPFALSGGERRRVALAGVLAMEPEALILDEPTSNLDARTRDEFIELLQPLRAEGAVIWLTSSAREAGRADRTYILQNGSTSQVEGGPDVLRQWRDLAAAGIELPAIYELARGLEARGRRLPEASSSGELQAAIIQDWRVRHS